MNTLTSPGRAESTDDPAERQLVERCRAGDSAAFDEIVARYHERVARVACRLSGRPQDVDDIVQDVFLRVLQRINTFRASASFSTWLIAIAVNCCRSRGRRQALRKRVMWALWRRGVKNEAARPADLAARVQDAVSRMPATYREPIVLRYLEELSIGEIAEILNISTSAVEARLSRGRQRLKSILTNSDES